MQSILSHTNSGNWLNEVLLVVDLHQSRGRYIAASLKHIAEIILHGLNVYHFEYFDTNAPGLR